MNVRYRIEVVLTSLVLGATLAIVPQARHGTITCAQVRQLYSARILRRARAALLLALAREHAQRATVAAAAVRGRVPVQRLTQITVSPKNPQESADPKLKHLLASLATICR